MKQTEPLRLTDRLRMCADIWCGTNRASLAQLGRSAVSDSSFFSRPEPARGPTTATLERFARFLGDAANWPDGEVPEAVRGFVHVVGVTPERAQDHVG